MPIMSRLFKSREKWATGHVKKDLSQEQLDRMLKTEYGGIGESFYNLYALTGDNKYAVLAEKFYRSEVLEPLVDG